MDYKTHIIIIRLSAMGDVAMAVPGVRALSAQYSNAKITVVSRAFFRPFFDDIPNVSFFVFDDKKKHKGFFGILKLFWDLKKLKPNFYVDFHNVLRTKIVGFLFGFTSIKTTVIDKKRQEKKAITAKTKTNFAPIENVFQKQSNALKRIGFNIDLLIAVFPPKAILNENIKSLFCTETSKKLIGIAPFAQYQTKVYPIDLMQTVIDELAKKSDYKLLLFGGGKSEIMLLESLAKNHKNVMVVAGQLSFQEELKLISNLDVMLSMDSGNAHIAAMLGVNVITLWGATHPFTGFIPYNQPTENCLTADRNLYPEIPTSVYGNIIVEGYENAMRTILPSTVMQKIREVLAIGN